MKTSEKFWLLQKRGLYVNGIKVIQKQPIQLLDSDLKTNIMQAYNDGCIGLEDDFTTVDENSCVGSLDQRELDSYILEYTTDINAIYKDYCRATYQTTIKHSDLEKITKFYKRY